MLYRKSVLYEHLFLVTFSVMRSHLHHLRILMMLCFKVGMA